jgi:hypothetical protein
MSNGVLNKIEELMKALELGSYNAAPSTLEQGSALQVEDVSPVMHVVTFGDQHIKLQKELKVSKTKGQLVQFNRQLSYGTFGGSAQLEGQVGQEQTSDIIRAVVPMVYYSHIRRVTIAAQMAETQDGVKAEDREAQAAAKKLAGDIEFDLFLGKSGYSNSGVFDGSPLAIPNTLPNMVGLDPQVRESDTQLNTQDLMFYSFGSNLSNIISGGGVLSQPNIEDAWIRGVMNHGSADRLFVDPLILSAYSKSAYTTFQRFNLGSSPLEATTGVDIRRQAVSGGVVTIEASRFLSAQTQPLRSVPGAPNVPASFVINDQAGSTAFVSGATYSYFVSAANEIGESVQTSAVVWTVGGTGHQAQLVIQPDANSVTRYFNVYRTPASGTTSLQARLVGRVKNTGPSTVFLDLGNRLPGGITGFLVQMDSMEIKELSAYSRLKLAVIDLTQPEAHFRFCTLAVYEPRKNVLVDNLVGDF